MGWDTGNVNLQVEVGNFNINFSSGGGMYINAGVNSTGSVSGFVYQDRSTGNNWVIYADSNSQHHFYYGGGNVWDLEYNGVVHAHNHHTVTADNTFWCGVQPWTQSWYAVGAYNFVTASDRRLKKDVSDLPDCLDVVMALSPKRFRWIHDPVDEGRRLHWGFIAQEVGDVMDRFGHDFSGGHRIDVDDREGPTKGEEHHSLVYSDMVAVLWKAVQELSAEVTLLKARL